MIAVLAPAAGAATLGSSGGAYFYDDSAGTTDNAMLITQAPGDPTFYFSGSVPLTVSAPCIQPSPPTEGRCPYAVYPGALRAKMGAGNDMASGATELINSTVSFDGGAGNDRLFYAQAGSIALTGDTGDDTLVAPLVNGVSSLIGGPGNDSARMAGNAAVSVNVTLDGIANDGPAGQQVSNVDVENVTTPGGSITGDAGPNVIAIGAYSGANTVSAGGGDDTVTTSIGSDTVDLGAGRDSAATGDRNDTVEARDGEADVIDCGDGVDSVVADAVDVTATTCETVSRPEPVNPPDNSFELKMETLNRKTGTATLTIVVPGPGKLNAVGKGIKSATATATAPGPVELVIKPRSRAKKKLNHTGKYKVTVSVQYTPTLGSANTQTEKLTLKKRI